PHPEPHAAAVNDPARQERPGATEDLRESSRTAYGTRRRCQSKGRKASTLAPARSHRAYLANAPRTAPEFTGDKKRAGRGGGVRSRLGGVSAERVDVVPMLRRASRKEVGADKEFGDGERDTGVEPVLLAWEASAQ